MYLYKTAVHDRGKDKRINENILFILLTTEWPIPMLQDPITAF